MSYTMDDMIKAGHVSRRGVRFWEEIGLLGTVERSKGNQRRYTEVQMNMARVIAAAQLAGWQLTEIRALIETYDDDVRASIVQKLARRASDAKRLALALPDASAFGL